MPGEWGKSLALSILRQECPLDEKRHGALVVAHRQPLEQRPLIRLVLGTPCCVWALCADFPV